MSQRSYEKLHYYYGDLHALFLAIPWAAVTLSGRGMFGKLAMLETLGKNHFSELKQYPDLQCEPLELFYILRRQTSALDWYVVNDVITLLGGWREANYLCLFCCLAPSPDYLPLLRKAKEQYAYAADAAELALASCGDILPSALETEYRTLLNVRAMLAELPPAALRLRRHITREQELLFNEERLHIRAAYLLNGLECASKLTQQGLTGYYGMSLLDWNRLGCPEPPRF